MSLSINKTLAGYFDRSVKFPSDVLGGVLLIREQESMV